MTRTPDEIKKGVECCAASIYQCEDDCPYREGCRNGQGGKVMNEDALALIQQLQAENAEQAERIRVLEDHLREATKKVKQLEAERDAAVETIYEMAKCITEDVCEWCDGVECERLCMQHTILRPGFKWRGVQKEDSDA